MSPEASLGGDNFVTPNEKLGNQELPRNVSTRLGDVEGLTKTVLTVVVISIGAMIVSAVIGVAALIMDQLHFNNELYRDGGYTHKSMIEHSEKTVIPYETISPDPNSPLNNLR